MKVESHKPSIGLADLVDSKKKIEISKKKRDEV